MNGVSNGLCSLCKSEHECIYFPVVSNYQLSQLGVLTILFCLLDCILNF